MSADTHGHDPAHGGHAHGHGHGDAPAHGTRTSYLIGFFLSVVLTAVPFWLVMAGGFDKQATALAIMGFALVQVIVHMIFFLHMNTRSEEGWNFMALVFTIVVVVISLIGSLWVMYHMNANMMPGVSGDMSGM